MKILKDALSFKKDGLGKTLSFLKEYLTKSPLYIISSTNKIFLVSVFHIKLCIQMSNIKKINETKVNFLYLFKSYLAEYGFTSLITPVCIVRMI